MKIAPFAAAFLCSIASIYGAKDCTHGKLYVVDDSTSDVHVIDVSGGNLKI